MSKAKIWNYVCVALMAVILILQFIPFWNYGGQGTSIQSYIWFPSDYSELTGYLETEIGSDYSINSIVFSSVAILLTMLVGAVLCLIKRDSFLCKIVPIVGGIIGVYGFITKPAFHLGTTWVIQLILCIAIVATAIVAMVNDFKVEQADND